MIRLENLSVRAGAFALRDISFEVANGRYAILMGRTGSGKTTLLEAICGLKSVIAGRLTLMGRDVTHLKPAERGIGFVPQEGALFPTMPVNEQISFALAIRKWNAHRVKNRVHELAELLNIEHLLDRYVEGLSGGERQRVALARALAAQPGVLCLDEPLSALDENAREGMYRLLKSIQERTGVTTLHITHSRAEAGHMGDVVFRLHDGKIRQITEGGLSVVDDSDPSDDAPQGISNPEQIEA